MTGREKRRETIPEVCGAPHPTEETLPSIDHSTREYVYYALTCSANRGHSGPHYTWRADGGKRVEWENALLARAVKEQP